MRRLWMYPIDRTLTRLSALVPLVLAVVGMCLACAVVVAMIPRQ